jgi:hypothetical protein
MKMQSIYFPLIFFIVANIGNVKENKYNIYCQNRQPKSAFADFDNRLD